MANEDRSFFGHPKGLSTLFFTEMWERFSYYGMRALLILFMTAAVANGGLGMDTPKAASIYGWYTSLVYAVAIPGGWLADRFLGQRKAVLWGGILITLGHFSLAFHSMNFFFMGLGLIIAGTGLLKPNISTIVGQLYSETDSRRDAGFSIFYMGINLGAMIGPLISGYLGQKIDWHWGFASAGVGMTLGLIQYIWGAKRLGEAGLYPLGKKKKEEGKAIAFLTREEWHRVGALTVLFVFSALFWGAFEQAGSSLNLFAEHFTANTVLGWNFPASWFQSVNSVFIIALAPIFAWFWIRLKDHEPSSPTKFGLGLLFVGLGFFVMAGAANVSGPSKALVSPMWLVVCYFLHTVGELCLSPVGLSVVTKLAPARMVGSMMGLWFLSISVGNKIGGWVAGQFEMFPLPKLFGAVFLTTLSAAVVMFILVKPIRKWMGDVR